MCGCDQCRADRLIERLKRRGVDNAVLIPLREMRDNVPADCLVYGGRIAAMSDEDIRRMNVWARVTVQRNAATV